MLYVGDGRILLIIRVLWGHKVVRLMGMFLFFYEALIRVVFLFDQLDWLCRQQMSLAGALLALEEEQLALLNDIDLALKMGSQIRTSLKKYIVLMALRPHLHRALLVVELVEAAPANHHSTELWLEPLQSAEIQLILSIILLKCAFYLLVPIIFCLRDHCVQNVLILLELLVHIV